MGTFTFEGRWVVDTDPDSVWEILVDPAAWCGFAENIERVEGDRGWVDGGSARVIYRATAVGGEVTADLEVEEHDRPHRLVVVGSGDVSGHGTVLLDDVEGGTAISYDVTLVTDALWLKPAEPILQEIARQDGIHRQAGERVADVAGARLVG